MNGPPLTGRLASPGGTVDVGNLDKRGFEAELRNLVAARQTEHFSEKCVQMENCNGCSFCTFCRNSKDLTRCHYCERCDGCTDCSHCDDSQTLLACQHCQHSSRSVSCSYLNFCTQLSHCHYCFGCVGLNHADFQILNQPYDRSEYFRLTRRLLEHWG